MARESTIYWVHWLAQTLERATGKVCLPGKEAWRSRSIEPHAVTNKAEKTVREKRIANGTGREKLVGGKTSEDPETMLDYLCVLVWNFGPKVHITTQGGGIVGFLV